MSPKFVSLTKKNNLVEIYLSIDVPFLTDMDFIVQYVDHGKKKKKCPTADARRMEQDRAYTALSWSASKEVVVGESPTLP